MGRVRICVAYWQSRGQGGGVARQGEGWRSRIAGER
jgi:hypothetical protein